MIFWNIDFSNTNFVKRPFLILMDEFCPGWIRIRITLTAVETSLFYIFWKVTHHVSSWFVSAYNIGTFHWSFGRFSSPNAKLSASFPNHLGEVTRTRWKSTATEIIARITDFVVPKRNFQNFFYLNEKIKRKRNQNVKETTWCTALLSLYCRLVHRNASLWFSVSWEKWREFMTDRISWFLNFTPKKKKTHFLPLFNFQRYCNDWPTDQRSRVKCHRKLPRKTEKFKDGKKEDEEEGRGS